MESIDINGKRAGLELGKPVDQWAGGRFSNLDASTSCIIKE